MDQEEQKPRKTKITEIRGELKVIRYLLFIIVVPLVIYLLQLLSFIIIPFLGAVFLAFLFMPVMRWTRKFNVPRWGGMVVSILIMVVVLTVLVRLVQMSGSQILSADSGFWFTAQEKLETIFIPILESLGFVEVGEVFDIQSLLQTEQVSSFIYQNFGNTVQIVQKTVSTILMTLFFLVLLLAGSLNVPKIMQNTIFPRKAEAFRTLRQAERSISKFLFVKTVLSALTGLGFALLCWAFGVSFPLFWGLLAFSINFIQVVGSVVVTSTLGLFALVELDPTGKMLAFFLLITGVQVLLGGVLEPIFMGQTFRVNTVTVLVVLMLWGFIWGVPGMILAIPITALIKIILEQFPNTRYIAEIMS